ncbi:MAG: MoxR family ATPase [Actinobacteria bacterium]|jgi:MoxR-like ATPase|nr:MoxR family ATPase [Actinomycetota bacterium]MBT3747284.1 MoxR family ATPase [Actinomycetota bacterium]MBT3969866.1 MoxR family ATPase [Actinomycetota bacterium]MBT4009046.1 MoxR family ATPase [Actinomycetota bacterium]MBT4303784.1 MoxR family ATPase [Actinomycetota bacterium]
MNIHDATSADQVQTVLGNQDYLADQGLATAIFLALRLKRPLLLEGEAGVGKTEVAKALAAASGGKLIRLQCYEGLDAAQAVYEWDYAKQLLHLRAAEATGAAQGLETKTLEDEMYQERFLIRRPLMQALASESGTPPVLLIDEVDRADDEFEAFLLEILSDYSVTVPELGTFTAEQPPVVIITSNRTRDVHDALKRRCFYHWVEHPGVEREIEILRLRAPEVSLSLARDVALVAAELRQMGLYKPPGVAETIDWAEALVTVGVDDLDEEAFASTISALLKYREDQQRASARGFGDILALVRPG